MARKSNKEYTEILKEEIPIIRFVARCVCEYFNLDLEILEENGFKVDGRIIHFRTVIGLIMYILRKEFYVNNYSILKYFRISNLTKNAIRNMIHRIEIKYVTGAVLEEMIINIRDIGIEDRDISGFVREKRLKRVGFSKIPKNINIYNLIMFSQKETDTMKKHAKLDKFDN